MATPKSPVPASDEATDAPGTRKDQTAAGGIDTSVDDNTSRDAGHDSVRESAEATPMLIASQQASRIPMTDAENSAPDMAAQAIFAVSPHVELQSGSQGHNDAKHPVLSPDSADDSGKIAKRAKRKKLSAGPKKGPGRRRVETGEDNGSIAADSVVRTRPSSAESHPGPQTRVMKAMAGTGAPRTIRRRDGLNGLRAEPQTANSTTEARATKGPSGTAKRFGAAPSTRQQSGSGGDGVLASRASWTTPSHTDGAATMIDSSGACAAGHRNELQPEIGGGCNSEHFDGIAAVEDTDVTREDESGEQSRTGEFSRRHNNLRPLTESFDRDDLQKDTTTNTNAATVNGNTGTDASKKRKSPDSAQIPMSYVSTTDTNSEPEDFQAEYNARVDQQPGGTRCHKRKKVAFEPSSHDAPDDSPMHDETGSHASTAASPVPRRRGMISNRIRQKMSLEGDHLGFEVHGRWDVKVEVLGGRPKLWFSPIKM